MAAGAPRSVNDTLMLRSITGRVLEQYSLFWNFMANKNFGISAVDENYKPSSLFKMIYN